ncbi:MAG: restriction endonuclease subunit S [Candidatus Zixiibacteriota bacterium]
MMWPEIPLSIVLADSQNGTWGSPPKKDGSDLPVLRSTNIHDAALVLLDVAFRSVPEKSAKRYQLLDGDIIVTTSSGSRHLIGKNALFQQPEDGQRYLFSNFTLRLRPRRDVIIPRYLHLYLNSSKAKSELLRMQNTTSGLRNLPIPLYLAQAIPLPAPTEQQRIVEILDQADALRRKRAEADAKAARILPSLFYKMFGDPAMNPKGWRIKPLSDLEAQVRYGLGQPPKASETGIALIRATNISRGTISATNMIYVDPQDVPPGRNAFLKEDEVILVRSGAYTGDVAQVTKEWEGCVAGYDLVITPGRYLTGEFVEAYLLMPFIQKGYFQNLKARAGQPHLNAAQVSCTPFLDVPHHLQIRFSEAVQSARVLRKRIATANENLERAFAVMLHQAFTGDLTAKWREAHMKELLAEMEAQTRALECPPTKVSPPEVGSKRHAGHDMFNKAALAAYITDRCHAPDRPMGRVKLAKLFYLVQQKAEIELTETFIKRAAGPLDDEIHKFLSLAQKSKWLVLCRGEADLKPVKPGANASKAIEQAQKLLGPAKAKVDEMLDQMKGWGYRAIERWATVLDASFELTAAGQPATVEGVKDVIQKHPEWVPKLNRDEFSDTNIEAALRGLRGFGFIKNQD